MQNYMLYPLSHAMQKHLFCQIYLQNTLIESICYPILTLCCRLKTFLRILWLHR